MLRWISPLMTKEKIQFPSMRLLIITFYLQNNNFKRTEKDQFGRKEYPNSIEMGEMFELDIHYKSSSELELAINGVQKIAFQAKNNFFVTHEIKVNFRVYLFIKIKDLFLQISDYVIIGKVNSPKCVTSG